MESIKYWGAPKEGRETCWVATPPPSPQIEN